MNHIVSERKEEREFSGNLQELNALSDEAILWLNNIDINIWLLITTVLSFLFYLNRWWDIF